MWFEDFQDDCRGGYIQYVNITILAILNLYVTPMPFIKFRLNPTHGWGEDVVSRISRWPPWQPSWRLELKNNNLPSASHQFLAESDLTIRQQMLFVYFPGPSWIREWNNFSSSKSPCCSNASHQVSAQTDLLFGKI